MPARIRRRDVFTKTMFYLTIVVLALGLIISGLAPYNRTIWGIEVYPLVIALPVMILTFKKFPLTNLLYSLIIFYGVILFLGGYFTYENNPVDDWLYASFGLSENSFDRIAYLAEGFIPAIALRELLIRTLSLKNTFWLPFLIVFTCLGMAALNELIEWWVLVLTDDKAKSFAEIQTNLNIHWDLFMVLKGTLCSLFFLTYWHNSSLRNKGVDI